ncbi:Gamma-glutamyltranspeptidase precursor [Posidoniimonas polymericola]|uniref:Glutathione hydrolase proenzyme n=1 Tax=Posidoniimonas polymericola TaxID=2528002 RepID=A0A5C5YUH0_9BACT|nr:gamma-glutamyltransferase [Posidoniimonas polymericola]TWT78426.1 Gamma-glutamyltranspeptidase precursor [Posidoniimonas polymericola]
MPPRLQHTAIAVALLCLPGRLTAADDSRWVAVATVNPLATDAAEQIYRDGGNAVDAAITAALTLGVVDGHNSGIGGGCLILVRSPDGEFLAIDGRETAPATATRDMYLRDGQARPDLSQTGPLASGTPGAVAAYALLSERLGALDLADLLAPGAKLAEEGFAVSPSLASALQETERTLRRFPASARELLGEDNQPATAGETVTRRDLARTYRGIASEGAAWFYEGPFAEATDKWMRENGGIMTAADLAAYRPQLRMPIHSRYRGREVVGFPPPSSGGVHVAQMLNMLEGFDLGQMFADDPALAKHLVGEVMKLAFADRAYWLGDSDFVDVPRRLASVGYAKQLAEGISLEHATDVPTHGEPPQWRQDLFGRHTTHIAAADSDGYWVAITATVNTTFGSKVVIPGTGVVMNNEMDDFAIHPGTPNAFGLIGAENNSVFAGKRPLSSMSPTIVLDENGEPLLTVGAAGGPKIITQVLWAIINTIDRGMTPQQAIAAPRVHHQWRPNTLSYEDTTPAAEVDRFRKLGHDVAELPSAGRAQMIARDPEHGFTAVFDPRIQGKATVERLAPSRVPALSSQP